MKKPAAILLTCLGILLSIAQQTGAEWVQAGSPGGGGITSLIVSAKNLFAGTRYSGIFLSADNGSSWKAVRSDLLKKNELLCIGTIGTNLFAGTVYGGVFLSTNNGATWKAVNSGMPETEIHCLVASGINLFAGTGGGLDALIDKGNIKQICHGAGVLMSTDKGTSWTVLNPGLPSYFGTRVETWIECLAVSETHLFAGTQDGKVWRLPLPD